jgi:hypothetical protein
MGEVKNAFIKSKMNKDLDARLLPSGEYRNAINTQVSKSEGAGVGSLENALGNGLVVNFSTLTGINGLTSIGSLANELNDTMYVFLTNNTVAAYDKDAKNFIIAYNTLTNASSILVQGAFLNFSTLNKIYGINVLENLLFWTDNRNQPRKINLSRALESSTYYSIEDQISVAKYNPYQSIELYRESDLAPGSYETTLYDVVSKFYPGGGTGDITGSVPNATTLFTVPPNSVSGDIVVGASIAYVDVSQNPPVLVNTGAIVSAYNPGNATQLVTSTSIGPFTGQLANLELIFNYNKYFDPTYNGDPNFLEDKFVRFAYRFQFEDGEYSIFSPFTQTAFTPKQDGYFMYNQPIPNPFNIDVDDESAAYRSTIVEFMENKVNKTLLVIPLPFAKGEITATGINPLRIISIDILYKESDALAVKVIDTVDMVAVKADTVGDNNSYIYNYQSKKPFKTLPADELIRVYDKVPVKAFGQEIISNRVVYSNFQDKHTPPASLDYNLLISEKSPFNLNVSTLNVTDLGGNGTTSINATIIAGNVIIGGDLTGASIAAGSKIVSWSGSVLETNKIQTLSASNYTLTVKPVGDEINTTSITEYPNHSLKQNRNYQVGVVLSDKFGRSSSVILSNSLTSINVGGLQYVGSTIYSPYRASGTDSYNWAGDSLKVLFNSVLSGQTANTNTNEPGVYEGDTTSSLYNPLGWYSYKIVVKQTEQEYYNVYLPGVLAAYPRDNTLELGKTSFAVLLNDNINKVPRDLSEVGPQQKQFRSSVQLFGRVENNSSAAPTANSQYFPGRFSSTVSTIATNNDLFNADEDLQYIATTDFYEIESNPLIAKISTRKKFGVVTTSSNALTNGAVTTITIAVDNVQGVISQGDIVRGADVAENTIVVSYNGSSTVVVNKAQTLTDNTLLTFTPQNANEFSLAVFETTPVESNLDIFWESSSSGSVSELNTLILNESNGAGSLGGWSTGTFTEAVSNPQSITGAAGFTILDAAGATIPYASISSVTLTSVKTLESTPVEVFAVAAPRFSLSDEGNGSYKVNTVAPSSNNFDWVYGINGIQNKSFIFYFTVVTLDSAGAEFSAQLIEYAALGNVNPAYVTNANPPVATTCPGTINKGTTGDVVVGTFYGVNGANISQNTPTGSYLGIYEGLSFSISTVDSSGSAVSPTFIQTTTNWNASDPNTPFSCVVSKPAAFNTAGTYTVTLVLSDAGPATSICTFDVILTEDGCITVTRYSNNTYGGGASVSYTDCNGNPAVETWCAACCGDDRQISYLNGTTVPGNPTGGNTCCFIEGDEVEMYDGHFKSIDLIEVGDEVKSFKDSLIVKGVVTKALKHIVNSDAKVVKINGITGEQNHPIFINDEWVSLASQGKVSEEYVKNFYNLEIDGDKKDSEHNYVIGGLIASGLGDNVELNKLHQRQPLELTAHLK